MHSEEEKLAKLADKVVEGLSSQPRDEQAAPKAGIKIKGNNGNINFGTQFTIGEREESRALLSAQRKELHELRAKCEDLGADPRDVWREVHTELSVTSLDEVTATQFGRARGVIQAHLERLQEEADKRRLIGKILRTADEKDARQELNNFCDRTFGRTHLGNLKRSELQVALAFTQDFMVQPQVTPQSEPQPQAVLSVQPERLELREFLFTYRSNAFWLFMFGFIVGKFWI